MVILKRLLLVCFFASICCAFEQARAEAMWVCKDTNTGVERYTMNPVPSATLTCTRFVAEHGGYGKANKNENIQGASYGRRGGNGQPAKGSIVDLWQKANARRTFD